MGGPVFAGPCLSPALPGQAVICSRDGHVQGLDTRTGRQLWDLEPDVKWVGEPITASAAVDETVIIHTEGLPCPGDSTSLGEVYTLMWICGSEGTVRALAVRAHMNNREELVTKQNEASQFDSEWKDDESNEGRRRDCEYRLSKRRHTESSAGSHLQSTGSPAVKVLAVGKLPGEVFSSPVAGGGSVYVGCRDDHVYRLDLLSAAVHDDGKL
jgi:acyl-CoA synthetase